MSQSTDHDDECLVLTDDESINDNVASTVTSPTIARVDALQISNDNTVCTIITSFLHKIFYAVDDQTLQQFFDSHVKVFNENVLRELFNKLGLSLNDFAEFYLKLHREVHNCSKCSLPSRNFSVDPDSHKTNAISVLLKPFAKFNDFTVYPIFPSINQPVNAAFVRIFVTSGRILFEVPFRFLKNIEMYPVPDTYKTRQDSNAFIPPSRRLDENGTEFPIPLSLTQVEEVFEVVSRFYNDFAEMYRYIPNFSMHDSICTNFIRACFYRFLQKYRSPSVSFLMCEQIRRLIYYLVEDNSCHPRWRELAELHHLASESTDVNVFHKSIDINRKALLNSGHKFVNVSRNHAEKRLKILLAKSRELRDKRKHGEAPTSKPNRPKPKTRLPSSPSQPSSSRGFISRTHRGTMKNQPHRHIPLISSVRINPAPITTPPRLLPNNTYIPPFTQNYGSHQLPTIRYPHVPTPQPQPCYCFLAPYPHTH